MSAKGPLASPCPVYSPLLPRGAIAPEGCVDTSSPRSSKRRGRAAEESTVSEQEQQLHEAEEVEEVQEQPLAGVSGKP
jgi:hypothetical protein